MKIPKIESHCGIYEIVCLTTGKKYFGSSNTLYKRLWNHHTSLKHGKHKNPHLQNAYNKYGDENFSMSIITYCERDQLIPIEQKLIDENKDGFNICKLAGRPPSILGRKFIRKPTGKRLLHREKPKMYDNWRDRFNRSFEIVSPDGILIKGNNVKTFSEEYNLNANTLSAVIRKKVSTSKGWHLPLPDNDQCELRDPIGGTHIILKGKLKEFCDERDLPFSGMAGLVNRKTEYYHSWCLSDKVEEKIDFIDIVGPNGEELKVCKTINKKICKELGIPDSILMVINGKQNSTKGWKLKSSNKNLDYKVCDPLGREYSIPFRKITSFAKEKNLSVDYISRVARGKQESYKGWCAVNRPDLYAEIISPDGKQYKICKQWCYVTCKELGLSEKVYNMIRGKTKGIVGGWSIVHKNEIEIMDKQILDNVGFLHKIDYRSIGYFARRYRLPLVGLREVLRGERDHTKGWCLPSRPDMYATIVGPNGEEYTVCKAYCVETLRKLEIPYIVNRVIKGHIPFCVGWRLKDNESFCSILYDSRNNKHVIVPGQLDKFAKKYGLDSYILSLVARGKREEYKGWTKKGKEPKCQLTHP